MNDRAQNFTRSHYNGHANKHETQEQAQRARRKGPGLPLKQYHNNVKRQLIQRFASGAGSLLDLACGRGGDIWKWIDAGISYVKGLDLSPGEIEEAKKRFAEARRKCSGLEVEFDSTEDLGVREVKLDREFDVVTCMFAIHYFFASSQALDCFLHNVVINLKEGGYFFGACPDGRLVNETIKTFGRWPNYKSPMLELKACWERDAANFGSGYTCAIGDTVTEGHGGSDGSYEYLVFRSTLLGAAARHGLHPIIDYDEPALDQLFQPVDRKQPCKHFNPRFPATGDHILDASLKQASKLNMAFCFQKRSSSKAVPQSGAAAGAKRAREEDAPEQPPAKKIDSPKTGKADTGIQVSARPILERSREDGSNGHQSAKRAKTTDLSHSKSLQNLQSLPTNPQATAGKQAGVPD